MGSKNSILLGSGLAALGIMLGAFGAHGLKQMVSGEQIEVFKTGVQYQMYHAFGLLVIGLLPSSFGDLRWASRLFLAGTVCFSGSLYAFTFFEAMGIANPKWLGPITPLGGLLFIIGWVLLFWRVFKHQK
jgi:uncharacterized membrane protein YgdD (TMEM256/DUF423 family)